MAERAAWLAVVLVLTSVVSAGYYLPVLMSMYMRPARAPLVFFDRGLAGSARVAVTTAVLIVLALGVWPTAALRLADAAATSLAQTAGEVVVGR